MWSETGMAATAMKEGASGVTKENEWRSTARTERPNTARRENFTLWHSSGMASLLKGV
jgi:hypothetical protein